MLDPALNWIIAVGFCLLLLTAGWHKLGNLAQFQGILRGYRLVPESMIPAMAVLIAALELVLALAWASGWQTVAVAWTTAGLMLIYGAAMGINLARGRRYIDCGCSFSAGLSLDANSAHRLSGALLLRNGLLAAAALAATLPVSARLLGWVDYLSIGGACLALVLLYGALNQVMINRNAIDSWRKADA